MDGDSPLYGVNWSLNLSHSPGVWKSTGKLSVCHCQVVPLSVDSEMSVPYLGLDPYMTRKALVMLADIVNGPEMMDPVGMKQEYLTFSARTWGEVLLSEVVR